MSELVATIDVGTNTAHLLLAYLTPDGGIIPIGTETRYVRLGQGVDASGAVHPDALERLKATLVEFGEMARTAGAARVEAVGTSASRDIRDRTGFLAFVRDHAGFEYRIITGREEALLTSLGAVACLDLPPDRRTVVVDVGGGSTELTYARWSHDTIQLEAVTSLDVGSVRLTERCFEQLPPTDAQVDHAADLVREALAGADRPAEGSWTMIGAAGTARALAALAAARSPKADDGDAIPVLSRADIREWRRTLLSLTYEETLELDPVVLKGRADVIGAGVLVLDLVVDYLGVGECIVSPWGLRHGLAIRLARRAVGRDTRT